MGQFVLTGIVAIVIGIVGCAIYLPKLAREVETGDYRRALVDAVLSVLSILILLLGISMVPYY